MSRTTPPPVRYGEMVGRLPDGPVDLPSLLPGDGPLELDIGIGRGRSLFERVAAEPRARVLGVERKAKWAYKVEERRRAMELDRARVLCADVRELLERAAPDGCLARAFVHFPDPWWKKRHRKRRVITVELLDGLARLIEPGGELFVQTDVEERGAGYEALLEAHAEFEPATEGGFRVHENPFGAPSNREARAEADGLPVVRLLARRRRLVDPD